jgi:hypothetical protein
MTLLTPDILRWTSPGPVSRAFFLDPAPVSIIKGPIGSGKTTTAIMKLISNALTQPVGRLSGARQRRTAIIRNTYVELRTTTIKSWFQWVPQDLGRWQSEGPPTHFLSATLADKTRLDWEVMFLALDSDEDMRKLLSLELSDAYVNEAREISKEMIQAIQGRLKRYPRRAEVDPPHRAQVICDTNPPDTEHWIYSSFEMGLDTKWRLHSQPSGLSADAENLSNLPGDYYTALAEEHPADYVQVYVKGGYGYRRDGEPVFPEYDDSRHCAAKPIPFDPHLPVVIGADGGLTCAATIMQPAPNGQRRALLEVVPPGQAGPGFFSQLLNEALAELGVRDMTRVRAYADPSSDTGADTARGDSTWMQAVAQQTGIVFQAAPSNELHPRLEAVRQGLTYMIDGRTPATLISPRCPVLRKAFASGYRYRKLRHAHGIAVDAKPDKNEFSHVMDAWQYANLGHSGLQHVMRGGLRAPRLAGPGYAPGGFGGGTVKARVEIAV